MKYANKTFIWLVVLGTSFLAGRVAFGYFAPSMEIATQDYLLLGTFLVGAMNGLVGLVERFSGDK